MNTKPYFVMLATPTGENTVCETRYGPFLKSVDSAARLARRIGGSVYERLSSGQSKLRVDIHCGYLRQGEQQ